MKNRNLCPTCRKEWGATDGLANYETWLTTPRQWAHETVSGCAVANCDRDHSAVGLCRSHGYHYRRYVEKRRPKTSTVDEWMTGQVPPSPPRPADCSVRGCTKEQNSPYLLCALHAATWRRWASKKENSERAVEHWIAQVVEPYAEAPYEGTYPSRWATLFYLLPEPLRWEYLYAVQQRDIAGRAHLAAWDARRVYLQLRQDCVESAIGLKTLGQVGETRNIAGFLEGCQSRIDAAYRDWSGVDDRDPRLIYYSDLTLFATSQTLGPKAKLDLRPVKQDWVFKAVSAWIRGGTRSAKALAGVVRAWVLADEVITARGVLMSALGTGDMNAIHIAFKERWPKYETRRRALVALDQVLEFARTTPELQSIGRDLPVPFRVDPVRHLQKGGTSPAKNRDEPFRFVPQPIIDWVMDHIYLLDRGDPHLTAEARVMIFLQERCGRRTIETSRLAENCISYDDQGAPYLEWREGKKPYNQGKRLPIHQETHDVIRDWQQMKRERGITSQWLFPSNDWSSADKHYAAGYLAKRVSELMSLIAEQQPFVGAVEGAEGNLVYFDLKSIDPYSFRHAFAQRLADATDADGRPTTPPDVLQDYMGHKSANTTAAYYEVTAKRRKKALLAITPRRLNLHGHAVSVDRERDNFTKVAVTLGHCSEPQNIAANGHSCALDHACESCPFFLVDPLERDGMEAKRHHLKVKLERASAIQSPQHMLDHYRARIQDCGTIIAGIDAYIDDLEETERACIREALESMADIRRRATAPRTIDLRQLLTRGPND